MLKDLRIHQRYETSIHEKISVIHSIHGDQMRIEPHEKPQRKDFEALYRYLWRLKTQKINVQSFPKLMTHLCEGQSDYFMKYLICLEVFKELQLISYDFKGMLMNFEVFEGKKVELEASKLYNKWVE